MDATAVPGLLRSPDATTAGDEPPAVPVPVPSGVELTHGPGDDMSDTLSDRSIAGRTHVRLGGTEGRHAVRLIALELSEVTGARTRT
jgi:hypothetical protein